MDTVIRSFADGATEDLFNEIEPSRAPSVSPSPMAGGSAQTDAGQSRAESSRFEDPTREPAGAVGRRPCRTTFDSNQRSYRVCFRWENGYADDVGVTDYH
jgi:hypothetical protein